MDLNSVMDAAKAVGQDGVAVAPKAAIEKRPHMHPVKALETIKCPVIKSQAQYFMTKSVNSYDLSGIRVVSNYDVVATLANAQTVFTDLIAPNGLEELTDLQLKWQEEYIGDDTVEFFNLNGENPAEAEMDRAIDTNTAGAFGNKLNIRMITSRLAELNGANEYAKQLAAQLKRMKRFKNSKMLANTEITAETTNFDPQWEGFITHSTSNNAIVAGNLTRTIIQAMASEITNETSNNGAGFDTTLVMLVTKAQLKVIKDLSIAEFTNAESSGAYFARQALLKAAFPGLTVPDHMFRLYEPDAAPPVLCIYEPQLPSGTVVMFDPKDQKEAALKMLGQFGPFSVLRPTEELTELYVVFDIRSGIWQLKQKVSVRTGVS